MFYVFAFLLPLAVLLLAGGLLVWHVRSWRDVQQEESAGEELEFGRRQFQRRVQTSGLLALLALGLCLGQLIDGHQRPTLYVLFWMAMLLLLGWIVLLALGDLVVGRQHVSRLMHQRRIAEAQLAAELDRIRGQLKQDTDQGGPRPDQANP
jgi:hypothetical protein